jgi:hypothetical protein
MNKQNQGIMAANLSYSSLTEEDCNSLMWMCTNGIPSGCEAVDSCLETARQSSQGETNNSEVSEDKKEDKKEDKSKLKNTLLYVGGAVVVVGCVLLLTRK